MNQTYNSDYYEGKLKKLDKKGCVKFALFCAKTVNPNTKESNDCIELVEKWLKDEKSVSIELLKNAVRTANAYANIIYYTVYSAYAIYTVYSTYVTWSASHAAISAMKIDPSKTEEINNYLEELLNPKPVTEEPTKDISIMNQTYGHKYYEEKLKKLDKKDCVKFSLFCAKIVNPNTQESNLCIELVEKWLVDKKSVSKQELWKAIYNAGSAAYYAVTAIYAVNVVWYTVYANISAAANVVSYAASCAVSAIKVDSSKTEEINNYLEELLNSKPVTENPIKDIPIMNQTYNSNYYEEKLKKLDKKDCVKFALFCARIVNPNTKESNACIELIDKWLKDEKTVSREELYYAASAAYFASNVVYYAAYAAATATADAVYAAYSAVSAIKVDPSKTEVINNYLEELLNSKPVTEESTKDIPIMNQTYNSNYYEEKLKKLDKKDCVKFALFCARIVNPNTKESNACIELIEKWLKNEKTINRQELCSVASATLAVSAVVATAAAAVSTAYAASNASYVAVYGAYAASCAVSAIKVDPSKTEVINNYLEELLNSKIVTEEPTKDISIMNKTYGHEYYKEKLKKLDKKDCVKFSLFCAKIVNLNTKENNHCISLVEKWLKDATSVTKEELWNAAAVNSSSVYSFSAVDVVSVVAAVSSAVCATNAVWYATFDYTTSVVSSAAEAAIYAIKVDLSKTEEINNYLEELLNPKSVTETVTMEDHRNQMKLDNVKKLTKEVLILIEANPEELVKLLNYDVLNEKMKVLVNNINCLNTIQTDI